MRMKMRNDELVFKRNTRHPLKSHIMTHLDWKSKGREARTIKGRADQS